MFLREVDLKMGTHRKTGGVFLRLSAAVPGRAPSERAFASSGRWLLVTKTSTTTTGCGSTRSRR